jgi:Phosphotransferase enzyme family
LSPSPPTGLTDADFESIESAVMESQRGRWFLAEFARRRRVEDAARVLAAIDRLEARAMRGEIERARLRVESERAAEVIRQLAQVLKDLRPLAEARGRSNLLAKRAGPVRQESAKARGLEQRFAALVELDGQTLEDELKLFG